MSMPQPAERFAKSVTPQTRIFVILPQRTCGGPWRFSFDQPEVHDPRCKAEWRIFHFATAVQTGVGRSERAEKGKLPDSFFVRFSVAFPIIEGTVSPSGLSIAGSPWCFAKK